MMLTLVLLVLTVAPGLTQNSAGSGLPDNCEVFETELHSRPDFTHRVMISSLPLPPQFSIASVEVDTSKGRSFYWCEMKVNDGPDHGGLKTLRHFDHNSTHWWVTDGCGGWFIITACPNNDNNHVINKMAPSTTTVGPASRGSNSVIGTEKPLQLSDLNSGALLSLFSWLNEQGSSIRDKLGADPNSRSIRSVDEEFAMEFGY